MKSEEIYEARIAFVHLAFSNPEMAAKKLHSLANALANCRKSKDVVYALEEILFIKERTIYNDLKNSQL